MSFLRQESTSSLRFIIDTIAHIICILVTAALPIFYLPYTRDMFTLPKQYLLTGAILIILLLWLGKIVLFKQVFIRRTILDIPLLALAVLTLVSVIASVVPAQSFLGRVDSFVLHGAALLSYMCWYWLYIQIVDRSDIWRWLLYSMFVSAMLAMLIYLFRGSLPFSSVQSTTFNTVSQATSVFGVFVAIMGILGAGFTLVKDRAWYARILPAAVSILSIITLTRLGFTLPIILFAVGLAGVLILGYTLIADTSKFWLVTTTLVCIVAVLGSFLGVPQALKEGLPVEIALGATTSWDVTASSIFDSAKTFFIGSGPGTFVYAFSQYRPDAFNTNQIAADIRFTQPYSTAISFILEFGMLASLLMLFTFILAVGALFSAWMRTRPSVWSGIRKRVSKGGAKDASHPIRLEMFVVVIVWIVATIGLFTIYYDVVLWWIWWTLLAASITGLSALVPDLIKEKRIMLHISPQYSLVFSFVMVVATIVVVMIGALGVKLYAAEAAYTKATTYTNLAESEKYLEKAITYRPQHTPYRLATARHFLQKARDESSKNDPKPEIIADHLARAVNEARFAADKEPNNVETWETLAAMYVNARAVVPDANTWARDALIHIVELEPSNDVAHWQLGDSYLFNGNVSEAEDAYRKAIIVNPDYIPAYVSLSQLYESEEELDEAIAVFAPIQAVVEQNPEILYELGRMHFNRDKKDDLDKAEELWLTAASLVPDYSNVLFSLGLLYERKQEYNKALGYYQTVRTLNPDNADVREKIRILSR